MIRLIFISLTVWLLIGNYTNSYCQTTPLRATPNTGEGINAFLLRNGFDAAKVLETFFELNVGKFSKNNGLLANQTYILPTKVENTLCEPLLGATHQNIKIESNTLSDAIFYLISGHGGPDPGATGKHGKDDINEDEYAYDITLRLGRALISKGAKVYFLIQDNNDGIRDDKILVYDNDETCMGEIIPLNQIDRLRQRVEKVNLLYKEHKSVAYQRSISIHLDSRSNEKQIDVFFYHLQQSLQGKALAENMRNVFNEKYKKHQPTRGFTGTILMRDLYELKYTQPVSVFVELGNIQNYRDQQRFIKAENREALAQWLAEGFIRDYPIKNSPSANRETAKGLPLAK